MPIRRVNRLLGEEILMSFRPAKPAPTLFFLLFSVGFNAVFLLVFILSLLSLFRTTPLICTVASDGSTSFVKEKLTHRLSGMEGVTRGYQTPARPLGVFRRDGDLLGVTR